MLQAYIDDLVVIGITRKNVEKLTAHQPMKVDLRRGVTQMLVVFGETKPDIIAELETAGGIQFEQAHKDAAQRDPL
jgi:hypothetical protein